MTPDSKKKTAAKAPAKKKVTRKTAVSTKASHAKKVTNKPSISTKKTSVKKIASKKPVSTEQSPKRKRATINTRRDTSSIRITSEERWKLIAIAAYHKAEKRGFAPGNEMQDWVEAEKEIDELLMSG
jgi:hypothetical protein